MFQRRSSSRKAGGMAQWKRASSIFAPLALLLAVIAAIIYHAEVNKDRADIRSKETLGVRMGSDALRFNLVGMTRTLKYLAGNNTLKRAIEARVGSDSIHLIDDWAAFLVAMGTFDKVRWIDETGRERARVNYTGGKAVIVREQDLQNKEDRYYFSMTSKLQEGEFYLSPLDLNIEHGRIETPCKPIIRLSTPVFDNSGKRRGMVILSYLGRIILDDFMQAARGIGDHVMVVTGDGLWLKGEHAADEWGFMYGRKENMSTRYRDAWTRMLSAEEGQFELAGDLWTFKTVHPRLAVLTRSDSSAAPSLSVQSEEPQGEYLWKVVSHLPKAALAQSEHQRRRRMEVISLFLVVVLAVISWELAAAWTRQKEAEQEERRLAERLSLLMQSLGEGVFGVDRRGLCTFINPAALSFLGFSREEVLNKNAHDLFHQHNEHGRDDRAGECPILTTMKSGDAWHGETFFFRKDGAPLPVFVTASPTRQNAEVIGTVVVFQDVSERRKYEEQLRQSQKMEAVGTLAGGVAHDFNNILTVITGHAHLLQMTVPEEDPSSEDIEKIIAAGERGKKIVEKLRAVSETQSMTPLPIDLETAVVSLGSFLRRLVSENIDIVTIPSGEALTVLAHRTQLEQLLMNIVSNAGDAMPEGGAIAVTTGRAVLKRPLVRANGGSRFAFVSVTDTGEGMDDQTKQRAFDPFFTTKEPDKGMGLGLAVVFGIVKQLNGYVDIESGKGHGTRVTVYLPLVEE